MMDIKAELLQWSIVFDKKASDMYVWSETLATPNKYAGTGTENENISNKELTKESQKPIIRKFK